MSLNKAAEMLVYVALSVPIIVFIWYVTKKDGD